ncbi:transcription factor bHLH63 [Brachypodium distachyon]|uniref:BHLH domain-containing protein n=1 Tax=Brachypodium distachyon TaxID=15368 RepID=I1ID12_BRADI|nr:transcription factor bHLH63 [Brachypodium distachyon]KQK00941.1 hypothetical protein BRADI_3g52790v3 [Brachypodium distachyon]|eukprot:XP_003570191.1 transcription factor bHLH63 [Brachypodium distachyon]
MAHCGGGGLPSRRPGAQLQQETAVESLCQSLMLDDVMLHDGRYRAICGAFGGYLQEWPDMSSACYAGGFGATPVQEVSNGGNSFSCSGGGSTKRKSDAYLDAKGECKRPRGKQQVCELDQSSGRGKPEKAKPAGTRKKGDVAAQKQDPRAAGGQKTDYIHVRARRGQATDSHSLAERVRRERISERMRYLQELVPGCDKVTGKAGMLDEIINYVQSLQKQVEFLSMKIAASNPVVNFDIVEDLFGGRRLGQACSPAAATMPMPIHGQMDTSCLQMQQMHQPAAAGFGLEMVVNNQYTPAQSRPLPAATPPPVSAGASVESCLDVNGAAAWDIGSQNLFSGFDAQFQQVQSDCLLDNLKMEM